MKTNFNINQTETATAEASQEIISAQVTNSSEIPSENPTIFGEPDKQNQQKSVQQITQTRHKEISRVEQWINEWKQGMMRIEAGLY